MIHIEQTTVWPIDGFLHLKQDSKESELLLLEKLETDWATGICQFKKEGEGLFLMLKKSQLIGIASIQHSPDAPTTSGIALMQNCYILKAERRKGYGQQLFRHIKQFATNHFGVLKLNSVCPNARSIKL